MHAFYPIYPSELLYACIGKSNAQFDVDVYFLILYVPMNFSILTEENRSKEQAEIKHGRRIEFPVLNLLSKFIHHVSKYARTILHQFFICSLFTPMKHRTIIYVTSSTTAPSEMTAIRSACRMVDSR